MPEAVGPGTGRPGGVLLQMLQKRPEMRFGCLVAYCPDTKRRRVGSKRYVHIKCVPQVFGLNRFALRLHVLMVAEIRDASKNGR